MVRHKSIVPVVTPHDQARYCERCWQALCLQTERIAQTNGPHAATVRGSFLSRRNQADGRYRARLGYSPIDLDRLNGALQLCVGQHDFRAFVRFTV